MRLLRVAAVAAFTFGLALSASATPIMNPVQSIAHKLRPAQPEAVPYGAVPASAPEPSSLILLGTGALGSMGMLRRRFRRS